MHFKCQKINLKHQHLNQVIKKSVSFQSCHPFLLSVMMPIPRLQLGKQRGSEMVPNGSCSIGFNSRDSDTSLRKVMAKAQGMIPVYVDRMTAVKRSIALI